MNVSIIIVNYNTFNITIDCLKSIFEYSNGLSYEVILVDNASTECDPSDFLISYPQIKLIKSEKNGGFAKGNNLGIKYASGKYILLLNSDTYLTENAIGKAFNYIESQENIGVLGVTLKYPDGKLQHYTRRFRNITRELLDLVRPLLLLLPYKKRASYMLNQYYNGDYNVTADWVGGAFFMFPKSVLARLPEGKLDERFFMYGEDQLWCYQIGQLGYKIINYAETYVIHIENASSTSIKKPKYNREVLLRDLLIYQLQGAANWKYNLLRYIYLSKKYIAYHLKMLLYKLNN